jgi:parallel beta-helix repeat protein
LPLRTEEKGTRRYTALTLIFILMFLVVSGAARIHVAKSENTETAHNLRAAPHFPNGTIITIHNDGSIDPPSAPISNAENTYYTLTDDVNEPIVVERSNIVLDGAGHLVDVLGVGVGILLVDRTNVTIKNVILANFLTHNWTSNYAIRLSNSSGNVLYGNTFINNEYGIYLISSSNGNRVFENAFTDNYCALLVSTNSNSNNVTANNITNKVHGIIVIASSNYNSISANNITSTQGSGITVYSSSYNNVFANNVTNSHVGLETDFSSNNTFSANNITNNFYGIYGSSNDANKLHHNNFINNTIQAYFYEPNSNSWDNGYPSGGNYWSNYTGVDINSDGIGDTPYVIDFNNQDRYPLMTPTNVSAALTTPTPAPTSTSSPTPTSRPTYTPEPASTPKLIQTPTPTQTPNLSPTPSVNETELPTSTPNATSTLTPSAPSSEAPSPSTEQQQTAASPALQTEPVYATATGAAIIAVVATVAVVLRRRK